MEARGREEVYETADPPPGFEHSEESGDCDRDAAAAASMDPESVVPTPLDADAAFEVFHGRRYETRGLPGTSRR